MAFGTSTGGPLERSAITTTHRTTSFTPSRTPGGAPFTFRAGGTPDKRPLYWETVGPKRFEIPQHNTNNSADSLDGSGYLSGERWLEERERAERERERERVERERERVEKDKSLLGLSRETVMGTEQDNARPFNEVRKEYLTNIRDFGTDSRRLITNGPSVSAAASSKPAASALKSKPQRVKRAAQWQDTTTDLIKSLLDNLTTSRSMEIKRKCVVAIETEVAKLAQDSHILHKERMRNDEATEAVVRENKFFEIENRHLREEVDVLQEKLVTSDVRIKDLIVRLADSERVGSRLRAEEGCRDRLLQTMRQLEEEQQAKNLAEQQVRSQMDRIQGLTSDREELLHELERERAERLQAVGQFTSANDKAMDLMRKLSQSDEARQALATRVERLESEISANKAVVAAAERAVGEDDGMHQALAAAKEDAAKAKKRATEALISHDRCVGELQEARDQIQILQHQNERLRAETARGKSELQEGEEERASLVRLTGELPKLRALVKERDSQITELHTSHQLALEQMAQEMTLAAARNEELRKKLATVEETYQQQQEKLSASRQLEEENRRLQEHSQLAAHQFHKLGDESARLLHACQVERDNGKRLEAAMAIKEKQVSSLMEMNAKLTAEVNDLQRQAGVRASKPLTTMSLFPGAASDLQTSGYISDGAPRMDAFGGSAASPFGQRASADASYSGGALASYGGGGLDKSLERGGGGDRQRLMDEIASLMSSLQQRN